MKKTAAIFCGLLVVGSVLADPYVIAKQRARGVSDQNAAEQQRIQNAANGPGPASSAPASPAPGAPPVDPMLQATLNNINGLQADFAAFSTSASPQPDAAQKVSLLNNLSSAAQGKKASADSVKKLAADLMTAMGDKKKLTPAQHKKLAVYVHALFNSSHLSAAQQKTMLDDAQKILTDAGASLDDATNVVTSLKKIADETK